MMSSLKTTTRLLNSALVIATVFFQGTLHALERRFLQVGVRTKTPPAIDGRLDESVWQQALPFELTEKVAGINAVPPPLSTARILWNERGIYIGTVNKEPHPDKLKATAVSRDNSNPGVWEDDCNEIYLSKGDDPQRFHKFDVNCLGTIADLYHEDKIQVSSDWNASSVKAAAARNADSWTYEFFVSWEDLQIVPAEETFIGLQLNRFAWSTGALRALSNTGGNYFAPRFASLYLSGQKVPSLENIVARMYAVNPTPFHICYSPERWILALNNKIAWDTPNHILAKQKEKILDGIERIRKEYPESARNPEFKKLTDELAAIDKSQEDEEEKLLLYSQLEKKIRLFNDNLKVLDLFQ